MKLLPKFKKILYMGFRATLNFRKFKKKGKYSFKELKLLGVDQINELEISILMFKYNSGQASHRFKNQVFKPNHMVHSYGTRNRNYEAFLGTKLALKLCYHVSCFIRLV